MIAASERGRISITSEAVAQIVGYAAEESYGVVALGRRDLRELLLRWGRTKGVEAEVRDDGLVVELRVVVEHGLKLAEVAEQLRERVAYELERMVGLPIVSLEVHIEGVRTR